MRSFKEAAFEAAHHEVKKLVNLMRKRIDRIYDADSDETTHLHRRVPVGGEPVRVFPPRHRLERHVDQGVREANDLPDDAKKRGCRKFKALALKVLRTDEFKEFSWMADLTEQFEAGRKLYEALDDDDKMEYDADADDGKVIRCSHDPYAEDINDGDNNDGLAVSCMPRQGRHAPVRPLLLHGVQRSWTPRSRASTTMRTRTRRTTPASSWSARSAGSPGG